MITVSQIRLPIDEPQQTAVATALNVLGLPKGRVLSSSIRKISVDARHGRPQFVYTVAVELPSADEERQFTTHPSAQVRVEQPKTFAPVPGTESLPGPVVVCGMGPAGLLAALELAQAGYAPLVLERGSAMEQREAAVARFMQSGVLNEEANIQFGEGGAGTFSDGKLTTRIRDKFCGRVMMWLREAGVAPEVLNKAKPHIGTDQLPVVFTTLRNRLEQLGGHVLFNTKLTGVITHGGHLAALATTAGELPCGVLVLANGHSARDTFAMLAQQGVALSTKPFSVGARIEHLQRTIDEGRYHEAAGHPALPPAEYQFSTHVGGRSVYTFCMCPGGSVVAAASERGGVVTNGMSNSTRSGTNANAALVVAVNSDDFGNDPFAAIAFQRQLEQAAFQAGGGEYVAPAETVGSFLQGNGKIEAGRVKPTYARGVQAADLGALLPQPFAEAMRNGIRAFGRKLKGFDAPDTLLTGLETRTSSPVRIPRSEMCESTSLPGLWPCGEGAGYAGGIMSAASDGVRVAKAIIERYNPTKKT